MCNINTGVCRCKRYVTGSLCDRCATGFQMLEASNPLGCSAGKRERGKREREREREARREREKEREGERVGGEGRRERVRLGGGEKLMTSMLIVFML